MIDKPITIKDYYLLTDKDLIPNNHYEAITFVGVNPHPHKEYVYVNDYGDLCGYDENHFLFCITDESVLEVLKEKNSKRYDEIVGGGYEVKIIHSRGDKG